jgi:hypothetical protein
MICIVLAVQGSGVVYAQKTEPRKKVFNLYSRPVGSVDEEGTIYNLYGAVLGSAGKDGTIYNVSEINIGRLDSTERCTISPARSWERWLRKAVSTA